MDLLVFFSRTVLATCIFRNVFPNAYFKDFGLESVLLGKTLSAAVLVVLSGFHLAPFCLVSPASESRCQLAPPRRPQRSHPLSTRHTVQHVADLMPPTPGDIRNVNHWPQGRADFQHRVGGGLFRVYFVSAQKPFCHHDPYQNTISGQSLIVQMDGRSETPVEHTNGFIFPVTIKWPGVDWRCVQQNHTRVLDWFSCFFLGTHDVLGCHMILYFSSGRDSIFDLMYFRTTNSQHSVPGGHFDTEYMRCRSFRVVPKETPQHFLLSCFSWCMEQWLPSWDIQTFQV